jgi:hypothetical protein
LLQRDMMWNPLTPMLILSADTSTKCPMERMIMYVGA